MPGEKMIVPAATPSSPRKISSGGCTPIANDTLADTFVTGCWCATADATGDFKSCVNTMMDF